MFIVSGIVGGLLGGAFCAFLVALISIVPFLGWFDQLMLPAFYVAGPIIGLYIGMKTLTQ